MTNNGTQSMIYIVVSRIDQSEYTESRYFTSAEDYSKNLLVTTDAEKAGTFAREIKTQYLASAKAEAEEYAPEYEWESEEYHDPRHVWIECWRNDCLVMEIEITLDDKECEKFLEEFLES